MKKLFLSFITLFLLAGAVFADDGGYYITHYDFYGSLSKDKVLTVQETIDVMFTDYRHGIYRNLPYYYYVDRFDGKSVKNMTYRINYNNIATPGDKHSTENATSDAVIKIGDEDKTIIGPHTYTITYTSTIFDDRINLSDFFYYNVLGDDWNVPIEDFYFRIDFEDPLPAGTEFELYSGYNSELNDLNVEYTYNSNRINGHASKIGSNNAITIFCELPEGYFVGAKKVKPFLTWFFAILAIICMLITLVMIIKPDPNRPVQTVEFYPPKGISCADVGFLIDNVADDKDLLALYIEWAHKGYIKITENEKKELILTKLENLPKDAPEYQKTLFNNTFSKNKTAFSLKNVSKTYIKQFDKAKEELGNQFTEEKNLYDNEFFSYGMHWASSILFGLSLLFSSPVYKLDNGYLFIVLVPFFLIGNKMNDTAYTRYFRRRKEIFKYILIGIGALALAPCVYKLIIEENLLPIPVILTMYVLYIIICLFNGHITKRTAYNAEITGKLLGLKEFIKTAEMPKLEVLLKENPGYYFEVFPYAMVFGLADKWAKQFKELNVEKPLWFSSSTNSVFNSVAFMSAFDRGVDKMEHSVSAKRTSTYSSSSSGHGGHSGGGGGGGGGGSW
jgi:uncharacterized membrane protein YgcG